MRSLTKIWYKYKQISCKKEDCIITNRLFWKELNSNEKKKNQYI